MPTVLETLQKGTDYLEKYGIEEPRLNMEYLVSHVMKMGRLDLYLNFERLIPESALENLRLLTKRRSTGEPLQHLLGTVEFCDLEFATDARALIPRPETEELTEYLIQQPWPAAPRILDLGCGSGVIGLSLAKRLQELHPEVTLADLSSEALSLARENLVQLGLDDLAVTLIHSDLFDTITGPFDLIVANLPYIPDHESSLLSLEVQRDPALALYGGTEGTEIMEKFLIKAPSYLAPQGRIAMEFGEGQAARLVGIAEDQGFSEITIRKDLAGKERFLFAVMLD